MGKEGDAKTNQRPYGDGHVKPEICGGRIFQGTIPDYDYIGSDYVYRVFNYGRRLCHRAGNFVCIFRFSAISWNSCYACTMGRL